MAFSPPLISKRAIEVLAPHLGDSCEVLPWIREGDHDYSLLNIRAEIRREQWSSEILNCHGDIISNADKIEILADQIPPIFMLEGYRGKIFVSDLIAKLSVQNRLTGICFVDPAIGAIESLFVKKKFGKDRTGFVTRPSPTQRLPRIN